MNSSRMHWLEGTARACVRSAVATLVLALAAHTLMAQGKPAAVTDTAWHPTTLPQRAIVIEGDDRSGPRLGAAYLIGGSVSAERLHKHVAPLTTLFGWQLEHRFPTGPGLPDLMTEFVALAGGIEQGLVLPSASLMLAFRQTDGWEEGLGPTVTGAGVQLAIAAGTTHSFGQVNVPLNLAVAPGRRGASISVTTGFNFKRPP